MQLDPFALEQVRQPLPPERRLQRDPRLPAQLREDRAQRLGVVRYTAREHFQPLLIEGRNVRTPAM
jgi:hypothetical protein